MQAVDTNVLVRLITRDDEEQYQKVLALGPIWVSHVVLLEFAWVLQNLYGFENMRVYGAVEGISRQGNIVLESPLVVQAVLREVFKNKKLDFADVLIVEVARAAKRCPVLTFDKAMSRMDGAERL
jgi:predicted nucleic-acid-binding protein